MELNYYGQHISKSDAFHVEEFFKGLYGLAITYPIALTLSKLSLLALYWRIFRGTKGKLPIQIAAGLNIAWMLAAVCIGSLILDWCFTKRCYRSLSGFSAVHLFKDFGT